MARGIDEALRKCSGRRLIKKRCGGRHGARLGREARRDKGAQTAH
jgi:hypothetical protein